MGKYHQLHLYDKTTPASKIVDDVAWRIRDKVVLTTGVSPGGLGAYFVEEIARAHPKLLILAGRSAEKLDATARRITDATKGEVYTRALPLDLTSLAEVRAAAQTVLDWDDVPSIDVLVNNAGIMGVDYSTTVDGFEAQFGTNHLGPFLFTNLIMPKILKAKEPRIVTVSSDGHRLSPMRFGDYDFHKGENYNKWAAYGQSKTANMLMTVALAHKLGAKGLTAVSLHPGVITTNLSKHVDWAEQYPELVKLDKLLGNFEGWKQGFDRKSPEQGVATHVYAAFSEELKDHNGAYATDSHIANPTDPTQTLKSWATNGIEAEMLWRLSEKLVGQSFPYC